MKNYFLTGEVAKLCGVTTRQARNWAMSGMLKSRRLPGSLVRRFEWQHLIPFLLCHDMATQARSIGWDKCRLAIMANGSLKPDVSELAGRWLFTSDLLEAGAVLERDIPSAVLVDFAIGRPAALAAGEYLKRKAPWAKRLAMVYEDEATLIGRVEDYYDVVLMHPVNGAMLLKAVGD